jgi:hypothetical protein
MYKCKAAKYHMVVTGRSLDDSHFCEEGNASLAVQKHQRITRHLWDSLAWQCPSCMMDLTGEKTCQEWPSANSRAVLQRPWPPSPSPRSPPPPSHWTPSLTPYYHHMEYTWPASSMEPTPPAISLLWLTAPASGRGARAWIGNPVRHQKPAWPQASTSCPARGPHLR